MTLQPKNNFGGNLIGACIAILLAIPVGALIGGLTGDSYKARVLVYIICLCYVNSGVFSLFFINRNSTKPTDVKAILLWIISAWLWPLLLWTYASNKFQEHQRQLKLKEQEEETKRLKDQMKNKKWR